MTRVMHKQHPPAELVACGQAVAMPCRYVSLMTRLLQGSNPELQSATADVLLEVASKRMDPAAKLAMLQVRLAAFLHAG